MGRLSSGEIRPQIEAECWPIWRLTNKVEVGLPAAREQEQSAMHLRRVWRMRLLCVALCLAAQPAAAITIQIDYTYDTGNFFGSGNPAGATAGAQAKAALEAAASYYSTILTDSFSAIQTPPQFHSTPVRRAGDLAVDREFQQSNDE